MLVSDIAVKVYPTFQLMQAKGRNPQEYRIAGNFGKVKFSKIAS